MLGDIDSQIQRNISDPSAAAKYRKISDQDAAGIDEQIKAYESTFLVDAEKRGLAAYHPRWDAYRKAYTEVLEAAARGDIEAAKTAYFADGLTPRARACARGGGHLRGSVSASMAFVNAKPGLSPPSIA